jgi:hypothetical protein
VRSRTNKANTSITSHGSTNGQHPSTAHPSSTAIYYRAATPLLPYTIRAHSSISWASGEGVRRWQEWQRRFTHSWQYRHLRVVIQPCHRRAGACSVAHESRILAEGLGVVRIVRSRNVSPVSWQSRRFSFSLVILASARLSGQRSGCYGAAVVWGGIARVVKGLQGAGYWSNDVSKQMTSEANTEIRFTPLKVSNAGGEEPGRGQQWIVVGTVARDWRAMIGKGKGLKWVRHALCRN